MGHRGLPLAVAGAEAAFGGEFFGELDGHKSGWKERKLGLLMPPKRPWVARRFARIILQRAAAYDVIHYHGHVPNLASHIPAQVNFVQTRHDQGADCIISTRFRGDAICRDVDPAACAGCVTAAPNRLQKFIGGVAVQRFRDEVTQGLRRHKTVFVSNMLQENLARSIGPGPWGVTIHNFIDRAVIDAARAHHAPHPQNRQDPPLQAQLKILVAGKITPEKGTAAFLHTLAPHLPANMLVTIAGDGRCESELRSSFADRPQIRFMGWCNRDLILQMTAEADAIVVPSLWEEPFGSTIMEGLLMGKPTFALARGGTPEMMPYARGPEQLRLHPDLQSLVRDLVAQSGFRDFGSGPPGLGGAEAVVRQLLALYRRPPGAVTTLQEAEWH